MKIVSPRFLIYSYSTLYRLASFVANVTRENVLRMIMIFLHNLDWKSIDLILFLTWFDAKSLCVIYPIFSLFYSLFLYHKWCSKWSIQSFFPLNRISRNGWFINLKGNTLSNWSGDRQRRISWSSSFSHKRNRRGISRSSGLRRTGGNSSSLLQKEGYSHVQLSAAERCSSTQGLHTQQIPCHAVEGPLHQRESDKENGYRHQRMDEAAWDCRWWSQLEHHRQDPTKEKGGVLRLRKTFKQEIFSSSQKTCK